MNVVEFTVANPEETQALAAALALACNAGDCIALHGDLGTGKTSFARGFIRALTRPDEDITSPTFNLVQTYKTNHGTMLWHFDLYRLKQAADLQEIGLEEALIHGITLIEWPELASEWLPSSALSIYIAQGDTDTARLIALHGEADYWGSRLSALQAPA